MQRRRAVGLTRVLTTALLAIVTALTAGLGAPAAAQAAEPVALVSITPTSIQPALPRRDGTLTLSGQVKNISKQRLFRLQAIFWRNQAPITGRDGVDQALASAANDPIGARLSARDFQDLYTPADPYLEPGKTVDFSLTVRIADLELSPSDGIYLMGVHVLQNGANLAVGRTRVFVPVLEHEPQAALRMTSVVLLSSRPSLVRKGVLSDDHLASEIGPTGRLATLLSAASTPNLSFAVDPALIEELTEMRAGYSVLNGDGATGQAAASRWLEDFEDLKADHDGYRLLYGSPDIAALVHSKQQGVLVAAVAAGNAVPATRSLPVLVLPANGAADEATVAAAEALHPALVMLADASAETGTPLLAGPGKAPIVTFTSTAFGGGPGPDPQVTPVHLQQRMLADTWIQASTAADGSTLGRVRLITNVDQAKGDDAGVDAPWMQRSTLTDLRNSSPTKWDQNFRYPATARAAELAPAQLNRLRHFTQSQRTYADLLVNVNEAKASGDAAAARAASSFWRKQTEAQSSWLQPQQSQLDDLLQNGVQISSTHRVSTVAREGVEFPITIRNTLPDSAADPDANAVRVRLEFISDNAQRLRIEEIRVPLLRADENTTANARVTAKANGTVPVTAQLVTESGAKIGRPVIIEVQVTQNGTTGWVIAIAAGIVLATTTALRIRQVTRERSRASEQTETTEPTAALSSAAPTDVPALNAPDSAHIPDRADHLDV